jgi:hypothetical protein
MVPFVLHGMDLKAIISDAKRRKKASCNRIATFAAAKQRHFMLISTFSIKHHVCHDELPLIKQHIWGYFGKRGYGVGSHSKCDEPSKDFTSLFPNLMKWQGI